MFPSRLRVCARSAVFFCNGRFKDPHQYDAITRGLKTRWARPGITNPPRKPTFDYSGDLTLDLPEVKPDDTIFSAIGLDPSEVSEAQSTAFSIHTADNATKMKLIEAKIIEKFGRHNFDRSSLEVRIALLTTRIRNGIRHCQEFPKDKRNKSRLIEDIQLRRRRLSELKQMDSKRFDWLCNELQLKYNPLPPRKIAFIPRRSRLRSEAVKDMMAMKDKKLAELREALAKESENYYAQKEEVMALVKADRAQIIKDTQELRKSRVKTGYAGDLGEIAVNLANLKFPDDEKWWRKHPEVLKRKYGSRYKPSK